MMKEHVKANSWWLNTAAIVIAILLLAFISFPAPGQQGKGEKANACSKNNRSSANTTSFLVI